MKTIEQLTLKEAEKLREEGNLKYVSSELIPKKNKSSIDFYLQQRAGELMTDVMGIPISIDKKYNFYRTNRAEVIRMPILLEGNNEQKYRIAA